MCAMRFQHATTYDAAPDAVFAMLCDPAFRERVAAAQSVVSVEVTVTPSGSGCDVVLDQVQDTAGLPAIAKKIAGDTTRAVVAESWVSPTAGTIEISAPGKPTKAVGTLALVAEEGSTRHVVDLDVTVKVPLVGGKLESLMADNIKQGLAVEATVGHAWLEGER
jgi:hypothetical protein